MSLIGVVPIRKRSGDRTAGPQAFIDALGGNRQEQSPIDAVSGQSSHFRAIASVSTVA